MNNGSIGATFENVSPSFSCVSTLGSTFVLDVVTHPLDLVPMDSCNLSSTLMQIQIDITQFLQCDLGRFRNDVKNIVGIIPHQLNLLCPGGTVKLNLLSYRSEDDGEHTPFFDEDVMGCTHSHNVLYLYLRTCRLASVCGCIEK